MGSGWLLLFFKSLLGCRQYKSIRSVSLQNRIFSLTVACLALLISLLAKQMSEFIFLC
jgi:hypothetical protein